MDQNLAVIPTVIEQHAEDAAFQWIVREGAICEPHYSLDDLASTDEIAEAHLDGLRIAGTHGWEICKSALFRKEPAELFAASVLAFESGIDERIQIVTDEARTSEELSKGIISALGWLEYKQAEPHILNFLNSESSDLCRIGIAACSIHRVNPGHALSDALSDPDDSLRARALKAVGELGRIDLLPVVIKHIDSEDDDCRFFASWSGGIFGEKSVIPILKDFAEKAKFRHNEKACDMAVRLLNPSDAHTWLQELSKKTETQRIALKGAGALGDPVVVPWLIQMMEIPETARVAGEAFSMITGVNIDYDDLEGECPEGYEAGPTESPEDEDVKIDPDEALPWPEPGLISEWWKDNEHSFHKGTRYLLGNAISVGHMEHVLKIGLQLQRTAAALELAIRHALTAREEEDRRKRIPTRRAGNPEERQVRSQPLFEVRAPGFRQKKALGLGLG